jgi:hypothetical protein
LIQSKSLVALDGDVPALRDYPASMLDGARGKADKRVNGVPFAIQTLHVIYDKALFAKHSLAAPTTWDEPTDPAGSWTAPAAGSRRAVGRGRAGLVARRAGLTDHPHAGAIVMATDMTIGMALWTLISRHSRARIAEMSAAMYLPFVALLAPYWMGVISGGTLMIAGHALMFAAMLAAMLWQRAEYAHHHGAS